MKKERNIREKKQRRIAFSLLNCKSKTTWTIGAQLTFRTGALHKAEQMEKSSRTVKDAPRILVKPGLNRMSIGTKVELGYRVYRNIRNNPDFSQFKPVIEALLEAVEALDEAQAEFNRNGCALNIERLWDKEEAFDDVFRSVLSFIDWIARGSEDVYRSAGITWKK